VPDGVCLICISSTSARDKCSWPIRSDPFMRFTGSSFRLGLRGTCFIRYNACSSIIPTVSLGITSTVASSCGHDSGHIEPRVAHKLAGDWATHRGPAACTQHRRPRLTSRGYTDQTPPSDEGQPCGHIREEQRHHRCTVPREAMPRGWPSFRLLTMTSPYRMTYASY